MPILLLILVSTMTRASDCAFYQSVSASAQCPASIELCKFPNKTIQLTLPEGPRRLFEEFSWNVSRGYGASWVLKGENGSTVDLRGESSGDCGMSAHVSGFGSSKICFYERAQLDYIGCGW